MNDNPYAPPRTQTAGGRKFQWRTIPAVLMFSLGGLLAIAGLFQAFCGVVWFCKFGIRASFPCTATVMAYAFLPSAGAAAWVWAAVFWRRGWWIRAIVVTCVGYGALALTDAIGEPSIWPPF